MSRNPSEVLILSNSFDGGAGGAARNVFLNMRAQEGAKNSDFVFSALIRAPKSPVSVPAEENVHIFRPRIQNRLLSRVVREVFGRIGSYDHRLHHSFPLAKTGILRRISSLDPDLINIHWLGDNFISIREIGDLGRPLVWTVHDEWVYRGGEHYGADTRYTESYPRPAPPKKGLRLDVNRYLWNQKSLFWKNPIHFVAPSRWIYRNLQSSPLCGNNKTYLIPYAVDPIFWRPQDREESAHALGLDPLEQYIGFGAVGADTDWRKGGDLFEDVIQRIQHNLSAQAEPKKISVAVFGTKNRQKRQIGEVTVHELGPLGNADIRSLYSLVDVQVIPSRFDNLPQIGQESIACGTPVVAFDIGGLSDVVISGETGYLSKPFDTKEMAYQIMEIIAQSSRSNAWSKTTVGYARTQWDPRKIAGEYLKVFTEALKGQEFNSL